MNPDNFRAFTVCIGLDLRSWPGHHARTGVIGSADGKCGARTANGIRGVLCDLCAPEYAKKRIPPELATHAYRSRFIDTTTASSWRECYAPNHPLTRSESRHWKMELLRYVSEDVKLVTGSETGHDAAVPFVHYFEGMLSLGPYRVPDAGRNMQRIETEVPERVAKFQLGHKYRLPLWELVFHDCVVAQCTGVTTTTSCPRFGTSVICSTCFTARRPCSCSIATCGRRTRRGSCKATGIRVRSFARWDTRNADASFPDTQSRRAATAFANGVTITVDFGDTPFGLGDGVSVAPLSSTCRRY